MTRSGVTPDPRAFTYDGAGNTLTDVRSGVSYAYTYNNANRLKTVSQSGNLIGTYTYNGREQLTTRVITNSGSANGTTYFVHDQWGNIIAELDATGATVREYIWMPEAEIAPTRGSRTNVDRPNAVVSNVATTPVLLMVHVDQLNRPVKMTDATGADVWSALYSPFGGAYTLSGSETLNARFPGQWFQMEAGLHYNWHRHYDPTIGRYTQPDPLGFVDGPSVYAYAGNSPNSYVDPDGREALSQCIGAGICRPLPDTGSSCAKGGRKCEITLLANLVYCLYKSQTKEGHDEGTITCFKRSWNNYRACKRGWPPPHKDLYPPAPPAPPAPPPPTEPGPGLP